METTNTNKDAHTLETLPQDWEPVMFYVDVNWKSNVDDSWMIDMFEEYFAAYTIGRELSKEKLVPHYQCLVFQHDKSCYTNFIARVKTKYKLCGRAKKGGRKQYGKIKKLLEDPRNALIYTLKEKNYLKKWFDTIYVKGLAAESYIKVTQQDKMNEIVLAVANLTSTQTLPNEKPDRCEIVKFIIDLYFKKFDRLIVQRTLYLILYKSKVMSTTEYASIIANRWMSGEYSLYAWKPSDASEYSNI